MKSVTNLPGISKQRPRHELRGTRMEFNAVTRTRYNHLNHCRVCGLNQPETDKAKPWGRDGSRPSHQICCCCGNEPGLNDVDEGDIVLYRADWISRGCPWAVERNRPAGWDNAGTRKKLVADQLAFVPELYRYPREKFWEKIADPPVK